VLNGGGRWATAAAVGVQCAIARCRDCKLHRCSTIAMERRGAWQGAALSSSEADMEAQACILLHANPCRQGGSMREGLSAMMFIDPIL
jgi:hypothetical protein